MEPFREIIHLQVILVHAVHECAIMKVGVFDPNCLGLLGLGVGHLCASIPMTRYRVSNLAFFAILCEHIASELKRCVFLAEPASPFKFYLGSQMWMLFALDVHGLTNVKIHRAYDQVVHADNRLNNLVRLVEVGKLDIDSVLMSDFEHGACKVG